MENGNVADTHDEVAGRFLGEERGECLFLLLELHKFHFDQVVAIEGIAQALDEGVAQAGLADFEGRFEQLRARLQFTEFSVGQHKVLVFGFELGNCQ
jgi:hypothetical protein